MKNIETMLATENKQEAAEVMDFLEELNSDERKELIIFIQGIRFAKGMANSPQIA